MSVIGGEDRPTGTVTFLFTDVVGSTPLWDRYPNEMARALELHDSLVTDAVARHGGRVFSTAGDSFAVRSVVRRRRSKPESRSRSCSRISAGPERSNCGFGWGRTRARRTSEMMTTSVRR